MVEPIPDLIPDDLGADITEPRPVAILRAQASLLAGKTGKRIVAEVVPLQAADYNPYLTLKSHSGRQLLNGQNRIYGFNLIVPALENYIYQAFRIAYAVAEVYPVTLSGALVEPERVAANINEFTDILRLIFSSQQFQKVVNSLVSEVDAVTA